MKGNDSHAPHTRLTRTSHSTHTHLTLSHAPHTRRNKPGEHVISEMMWKIGILWIPPKKKLFKKPNLFFNLFFYMHTLVHGVPKVWTHRKYCKWMCSNWRKCRVNASCSSDSRIAFRSLHCKWWKTHCKWWKTHWRCYLLLFPLIKM